MFNDYKKYVGGWGEMKKYSQSSMPNYHLQHLMLVVLVTSLSIATHNVNCSIFRF